MPTKDSVERRRIAVRTIAESPHYINLLLKGPMKREIAELFGDGRSNTEIAGKLRVPNKTVATMASDIMRFVHNPREEEVRGMLRELHERGKPIHELPPEKIAALLGTVNHGVVEKALENYSKERSDAVSEERFKERYGSLPEHYSHALEGKRAHEDFLTRLTPFIRRGVRSISGKPDLVEDAVQEALIHAFQYFKTIKNTDTVQKWAFTVGKNAALDEVRKNKRRLETLSGLAGQEPVAGGGEPSYDYHLIAQSVEEQYLNHGPEIEAALREIKKLMKEEQEPLMLYVQGLTYDEIARNLGIELGTVKSRIARARIKLRERLGNQRK